MRRIINEMRTTSNIKASNGGLFMTRMLSSVVESSPRELKTNKLCSNTNLCLRPNVLRSGDDSRKS